VCLCVCVGFFAFIVFTPQRRHDPPPTPSLVFQCFSGVSPRDYPDGACSRTSIPVNPLPPQPRLSSHVLKLRMAYTHSFCVIPLETMLDAFRKGGPLRRWAGFRTKQVLPLLFFHPPSMFYFSPCSTPSGRAGASTREPPWACSRMNQILPRDIPFCSFS